jgi:hypothetical protein
MAKKINLPPGVVPADTQYPDSSTDRVNHQVGDSGCITFYECERIGWVVATLGIRSGARRGKADRTYAVNLEGRVCRVGMGPHVKSTVRVWVRSSRVAALQKYIDLHRQGLSQAGQVRDRISSRRAEGQIMRAEGRSSWRWSV